VICDDYQRGLISLGESGFACFWVDRGLGHFFQDFSPDIFLPIFMKIVA